ncbi:acyltransferase family protein [Dyadobacter luticola]|uniref:Acyltransferase n=1 Tax=Dyadobacter luticola TaxID=1979387 RepID=A0A5R9L273_9BACT|nr:acyltransferase [Dyadobacter luticola]TLV02498.1 acyltransferase [Dyadobacter luticola]
MIETFTPPYRVVSKKIERLFGLDLVRACCVIMVFLAHSVSINPFTNIFNYFGYLGFGVEAFFVLSGFLIGRIILRTMFKPELNWQAVRVFWVNRWLRTLPAYFAAFAIYNSFSGSTHNKVFYLFFIQNIITPVPGFFPHSWSLAVEEWFYLLFPLLMITVGYLISDFRNRDRIFLTVVFAFLIFGLFTKLIYHIVYQQDLINYLITENFIYPSWKTFATPVGDWDQMRKIVPFRLDAIAYGCLTAFLVDKNHYSEKIRKILLGAGLALVLICFVIVDQTVAGGKANIFIDVLFLPLFCCGFALILPYASICPRPGKITVNIITNISKTSYSFYLMHLLMIDLATDWYNAEGLELGISKAAVFAGTYFFTYIVAYLMYRFIELPFMSLRHKIFPNVIPVSHS